MKTNAGENVNRFRLNYVALTPIIVDMDCNQDTVFISMALAKGYLDPAQADKAREMRKAPDAKPLPVMLVQEGWMTQEQVTELEAAMAAGGVTTGKIAGYRLVAKIGKGGMGTVYKAEKKTGETVALKILPKRMAERPHFVERFLRESHAAQSIESIHIVKAIDVGISGGYYYYAMEYVNGESVETTLSLDGSIREERAAKIVRQIALALKDFEKAGFVHRDIKPGNILVSGEMAKLTDLGLAREIGDDPTLAKGMTVGTVNYMSPEQARGDMVLDTRSDIYSLGVTFYHMVTGVVPFKSDNSTSTMLKHLNEAPIAPITRKPELSRDCNDIILKMLEKDRDKRYQKAQQLVDDLERLIARQPLTHTLKSKPAPQKKKDLKEGEFAREHRLIKQKRWLLVIGGAVVLAIAGVILLLI